MSSKKTALIIMDGWGINPHPAVNAISQADTPFVDSLYTDYPNSTLKTHGENVGLPGGQMGNSEVGHMNLGAGRIVYQDFLKINNAVRDGNFHKEKVLKEAFEYARSNNRSVHLMGLVSDGGVHSHIEHVKALVKMADEADAGTFIHVFTDGRDTDPRSGIGFVKELDAFCEGTTSRIASLIGRYYGMDRDKRWERIKLAYDLLLDGKGKATSSIISAVEESYENGVTDEFILPIVVKEKEEAIGSIKEGDVVICFNFRTDRCRQITEVLTQQDMPSAGMETKDLYYVTMTRYDESYSGVRVVYDKEVLRGTIGEVVAENGLTQLRIAETEKYPHVTFFFSGGREDFFNGEDRIMISSPKVATYDLQPEMSAPKVRDAVIDRVLNEQPDFICLNFANTDMVGHTGDFQAAMKAAKTVDGCVKEVVTACLQKDYTILLTADHGNADMMINPDGSPNTAHTKNLVPLFVISNDYRGPVTDGKLADLAPTLLTIMGLPVPTIMDGKILTEH
ncbi:MAG: 2,3-bisphosphoglycerate-independent phosphoglycerate mutase [Bacteroidetes bacterium]|nr:2,3-bisphosphoglycerate-independent phosphoglycerate mutase [Bacteroidota bacterium]